MNRRCWRLIDTGADRGAWNMAVDEALMESVRSGAAPTLRFYRWSPACLSFGRNQPAVGHYDRAALVAAGVDVVRRPTGGRAVLHDAELTYSVVAPDRALGAPRAAYEQINRVLVEGLRRLGAPALLWEGRSGALIPSSVPCFADPAPGEVLVDGRKIVGSAQVRMDRVLLQHGSLPLRRGAASAVVDPATAGTGPAYLEEVLDRGIDWSELTGAIRAAWEDLVGPVEAGDLSETERRRADELVERYRRDDWTWRR